MHLLLRLTFWLLALIFVFMIGIFAAFIRKRPTAKQWRAGIIGIVIPIVIVVPLVLLLNYAGVRAQSAFFVIGAAFIAFVGCWMLLGILIRSTGWASKSRWWRFPRSSVGGLLLGLGCLLWALNFLGTIENWAAINPVLGLGGSVAELAGLWVTIRARDQPEKG